LASLREEPPVKVPAPPSPGDDEPSALDGAFATRDWTAEALLAAGTDPEDAADFGGFELTSPPAPSAL